MRRIRLLMTLLAVLAFSLSAIGQRLPKLKIEKYSLPNGLEVILHEDHAVPVVTVNLWYHVGSKNEKAGRTGFAHLFEHLMFEGTEAAPNFDIIKDIGATYNASTSSDRTNYFETLPSNYLELALWLESDRLGNLPQAITQEKLDLQRDVVKNERRQRIDNQPYGKSGELLISMIYPNEHPYSWSVIGSMEDLSAASLDDVSDFFKRFYAPNNTSLCITGDFQPDQAKQMVEKYFAHLEPVAPVDRMKQWIPKLDGEVRVAAEDNVKLSRIYMVWPTPPNYAPGDAEFDLLARALTSGKTSRLYKSLVYEKQICQDVSSYQSSSEISGEFVIVATVKEGHAVEEIEAGIDSVLKEVLSKGIDENELTIAKTSFEAEFVRSLQTVQGKANQLNAYNTWLGDPDKFQWDLDRFSNATAMAVNGYAKKYIMLDKRAILFIVPQASLSASEAGTDLSLQPVAAPDPVFTPPAIQPGELSNGIPIYLIEDKKLPLVQVHVQLKSGWSEDPTDRLGAGALTSALLDEGTISRNALQIVEDTKKLGAQFSTGSSYDGSWISLNVLKKKLDEGLSLMADVVLHPTFPADELERQRQLYLGRIKSESQVPMTTARKIFQQQLFGEGHPYSQPPTGTGTDESIKALTRDNLISYYETNYNAGNAAIIVSGDISMEEVKPLLESHFKLWKKKTAEPKSVPQVSGPAATQILIVDKPGAAQSAIVIGNVGISRTDPDYIVCEVLNNALGGQSTSRINMNIREDKGYTYGARSRFNTMRLGGSFYCYAEVQTDATKPALVEMIKEFREIRGKRPVEGTELANVKTNMIKGYPQEFQTIEQRATQMGTLYGYDLPHDEWATYSSRIGAVNEEAVIAAANRHIHPDALLIVIVGDRSRIEDELRKLKVGEVTVLASK